MAKSFKLLNGWLFEGWRARIFRYAIGDIDAREFFEQFDLALPSPVRGRDKHLHYFPKHPALDMLINEFMNRADYFHRGYWPEVVFRRMLLDISDACRINQPGRGRPVLPTPGEF